MALRSFRLKWKSRMRASIRFEANQSLKVHLTPKYIFFSLKYIYIFAPVWNALCLFAPFNPNLDFLQAVKIKKSGHHLLHNWASKGCGSIPDLTSQTSLHARLLRLTNMQISLWCQTRNTVDPCPLLARSCNRWWLDFVTFTTYKKRFIW